VPQFDHGRRILDSDRYLRRHVFKKRQFPFLERHLPQNMPALGRQIRDRDSLAEGDIAL